MNDTASSADFAGVLQLSVIVPARNEERNLAKCLQSLILQSDETFLLGRDWELIVVDDASVDGTRGIAEGFDGVRVLEAPVLDLRAESRVFTGKTNACWFGAKASRGRCLLFTDADTVHEPGDLVRALDEIQRRNVGLLSYSPRQVVTGFWQRALMPLVFSELASVYKTADVNDANKRLAAANGQFLMVVREAYFKVGGHKAVAETVLEDVALARRFKRAGMTIRFRYAADALAVRMYRSLSAMVEGWTKNLALLFPLPLLLATMRLLDFGLIVGIPLLLWLLPHIMLMANTQKYALMLVWVWVLFRYFRRVAKSNFPALDCAFSIVGLSLFVALLVRSWIHTKLRRRVSWKGREYSTGSTESPRASI